MSTKYNALVTDMTAVFLIVAINSDLKYILDQHLNILLLSVHFVNFVNFFE